MAKLLEYQGKEVLRRFDIPMPAGQVAYNVEEAQQAARKIGYPVVVKAQIYAGKRGKSGGIQVAHDEAELVGTASKLFNTNIRGLPVEALLVEQKVEIDKEIYVGVTADPTDRSPALIVCAEGGVEIEEVAETMPQAILKVSVDILRGLYIHDALNLVRGLPDTTSMQKLGIARILVGLYKVYREHDCKLVEVNPLALTEQGILALDARIDIDGDALGRQAALGVGMAEEAGDRSATLLEEIAGTIDQGDHRGTVHFVQIDPDLSFVRKNGYVPIGYDCVGAGVSLSLMDELVPMGFYPVNFCDSSGNPVGSKLYRITKVIFSQPGIEGYMFMSCVSSQQLDNTARGILKALKELYPESGGQPNIPTVLSFRGAWDEDALNLVREHRIGDGRWVRLLGRNSNEKEVAHVFRELHQEWRQAQGGTR